MINGIHGQMPMNRFDLLQELEFSFNETTSPALLHGRHLIALKFNGLAQAPVDKLQAA